MPDSSGRPDLRLVAQQLADRPRIVVGTGVQPDDIPPGDTYIPVYRQAHIPVGDSPYLWMKVDPETGATVELMEGYPEDFGP